VNCAKKICRYDEQHEIFVKTTTDLKALKAQCERTIQCMEAFVEQNMQVANKFQELSQGAQFSSVSAVGTRCSRRRQSSVCALLFAQVLDTTSGSASSRMSQIKERLFVEVRACFTRVSA
jgi:hypothetical protein